MRTINLVFNLGKFQINFINFNAIPLELSREYSSFMDVNGFYFLLVFFSMAFDKYDFSHYACKTVAPWPAEHGSFQRCSHFHFDKRSFLEGKNWKTDFLSSKIIEAVTHFKLFSKCVCVFRPFTSFEMKNWHFSNDTFGAHTWCNHICFRRNGKKMLRNQKWPATKIIECLLCRAVGVVSFHRQNSDVIFNGADSQACYSNLFDNVHRTDRKSCVLLLL